MGTANSLFNMIWTIARPAFGGRVARIQRRRPLYVISTHHFDKYSSALGLIILRSGPRLVRAHFWWERPRRAEAQICRIRKADKQVPILGVNKYLPNQTWSYKY